jgi:hypothetical protein
MPAFRYAVTSRACTTVVRLITTWLTIRGPPQPAHRGTPMNPTGPHHGMTGSPHPSATQPTAGPATPMLMPTRGPRKATSAGAYTGLTTSGPGAHAQNPLTWTQRP